MSETIDESAPIEWLRDLFDDASAASMYRWMMVAWLVAVGALIALDRIGWSLQGRTKPKTQTPPLRARLWRWRRADAPTLYSPLPSRTVVFEGSSPQLPPSIPLARSAPIEDAELVVMDDDPVETAPLMLGTGPIPNDRYWRLVADPSEPIFGLENNVRLELGRPPERYNPITDRIETLERDAHNGIASWPRPAGIVWRGLGVGLVNPPGLDGDSDDDGHGDDPTVSVRVGS